MTMVLSGHQFGIDGLVLLEGHGEEKHAATVPLQLGLGWCNMHEQYKTYKSLFGW